MKNKTYLGDAVYVENEGEGYQIKIYTSDGVINHDPIYLDRDIFMYLLLYAKHIMKWECEK